MDSVAGVTSKQSPQGANRPINQSVEIRAGLSSRSACCIDALIMPGLSAPRAQISPAPIARVGTVNTPSHDSTP